MKMERVIAMVGTLILGASAATSQAGMTVTIGGNQALTPTVLDSNGNPLSNSSVSWSTPDPTNLQLHVLDNTVQWKTADGSFIVKGGDTQWDGDPSLVFSASATNDTDSAKTYTFTFSANLTPNLLGTVNSHAQLGVTLTDGLNDGVTLTPASALFLLTSVDHYVDPTDNVEKTYSKNVDIGDAIADENLHFFTKDSSLICIQSCTSMYATLSFTLSAHDSVGFSGKITQTAVPLPAAGLLFGSSLLGLFGIGRRRKLSA